jgi:hypothetical protein
MCDVNVDARMHTCRQTTDSRLKQIRVCIILAGARVGKCIRGGDSRCHLSGQDTVRCAGGVGPTADGTFRCETFLMGALVFPFIFVFESWPDRACFKGLILIKSAYL